MEKKLNIKSLILEIAVAIVFSGSTIFFGLVFVREYFYALNPSQTEEIGFFARTRGTIQLRNAGSFQWRTINSSGSTVLVRRKDVIRTTGNSGATIRLESRDDSGLKGTLELGPNTYIILEGNGGDQGIKFVSGSLITDKLKGVSVSTQNSQVSSDTGSIIISGKEGEDAKILSPDGSVLVSRDGETVSASVGAEVQIDGNTGDIRQKETAVTLKSPRNDEEIFTSAPLANVNLEWDLFADWSNVSVELSESRNFDKTISLEAQGVNQIQSSLNTGEWYWRLKNTATGETSGTQAFSLVQVKPVIPVSPSKNISISYRGETPSVSFQWRQESPALSYRIQVSRNAQFQNLAVDRTVEGNFLRVNTLSEGEWWWRITPVYPSSALSFASRSESQSFTLEFKQNYSQVALLAPNQEIKIPGLDVRKSGVLFRWEKEEGVISYTVQVSTNPDMRNLITSQTTKNSYIRISDIKDSDTYYWRVSARAPNNALVPQSKTRTFTITPTTQEIEMLTPAFGAVLEFQSYQPYTFAWRTNLDEYADFTLKRVVDGIEYVVVESFVDSDTFSIALPGEGSYVWTITALDENRNPISESRKSQFQIRTRIASPELLLPEPNQTLVLIKSQPLTAEWTAVENADAYRVSLLGPDNEFIVKNIKVAGESLGINIPPRGSTTGLYTIQLNSEQNSSIGGDPILSETASYQFRVSGVSSVNAAVPTSPANGTIFDEERVLQSGIKLTWNQIPLLKQWTVEVSDGIVTRFYKTAEPELLLKNLKSGTYRWTVQGEDPFGRDVPPSTKPRFTIRPIPTPAVPAMVTPLSGQNIDMTNAKSLDFEWNAVKNADSYELEIYKSGESRALFRKSDIKEPRYVLTNLQLLDIGDFVLRLRARSEHSDISVTRTSDFNRVPFTLSVKIPTKAPKILTDELQYVR